MATAAKTFLPKLADKRRAGRHGVPVMARVTLHPLPSLAIWHRRGETLSGFGEGDTSSIHRFGESEVGVTRGYGFGDPIASFIATLAIRKCRGDMEMMSFLTDVAEGNSVYYQR